MMGREGRSERERRSDSKVYGEREEGQRGREDGKGRERRKRSRRRRGESRVHRGERSIEWGEMIRGE